MLLVLENTELRKSLQREGMERLKMTFTQPRVMAEVEMKLAEISGIDLGNEVYELDRVSLQ